MIDTGVLPRCEERREGGTGSVLIVEKKTPHWQDTPVFRFLCSTHPKQEPKNDTKSVIRGEWHRGVACS